MKFTASGGRYAAIAALTNIPATLFAAFLYEFFLSDSDRGLSTLLFREGALTVFGGTQSSLVRHLSSAEL